MRDKKTHDNRQRKRHVHARLETSSGGVVFRENGVAPLYLLIKDPYDNWGLPKGHVEGGETPVEAAIREVSEETGLCELHVIEQLPTIDWYFKDQGRLVHKFCHFFLLRCASAETRPQVEEGISECVWRTLEEALHAVTYANAREVLRIAGERVSARVS